MPYLIFQLKDLSSAERTDILRATTITIEPRNEWSSGPFTASIEEAHDLGGFYFHLGFDDRPECRDLFMAAAFAEAISTLNILKTLNPTAKMMLCCEQGEAEIVGPEVCRGIVNARAFLDKPGYDPDWSDLAEAIAANDSLGGRMCLRVDDIDTFIEIESYLLGQSRHVFELPTDLAAWAASEPEPKPPVVPTIIPDDLDHDILLNRRRQRVKIGDRPAIGMDPDDFVSWCRERDIKLLVQCPMLYVPEFPDAEAQAAFHRRWMEG